MGRYSYSGRLVADSQHKISIYYLRKHDFLSGYMGGSLNWSSRGEETGSIGIEVRISNEENFARLHYIITRRSNDKKDSFNYKVSIVSTDCYFGGKRYWFICPASGCGRRVAKLYQGQDIFACRHCYNLTYASRNENPTYRNYPYREILLRNKVDEIERTMKKRTYKGKLTKKHMRIRRIQKRMLYPYVEDSVLENLLYKI